MSKKDNRNNTSGSGRDYSRFNKPPSYYKNNTDIPLPNAEKKPPRESSRKTRDNNGNVVNIERKLSKRTPPAKSSRRLFAGRSEILVLTISLILFVTSIGGSLFKFLTKEKIATMVVPYGSVDIPRLVSGIIIRDEKVYTSTADGEVVYNIADGERVKKGTMICSIENLDNSSTLQAQTEELSKKIIEMQDLRGEISAVSTEVTSINNRIKADIDRNLLKLSSVDCSTIYTLKESLNKNLNLRNDKLLNENVGAVKSFVDEYRQYAGKIEQSRAPIYSENGGIVSYTVDGFESALTFDNKSDIPKEQTRMNVGSDSFKMVKDVKSGDIVFKIINSNSWYIVSYIDNELILDWSENNTVRLFLDTNGEYIEHSFKIDTIQRGEKESYVLLKSDKQVSDFLDMRTISFKTFDSVYSGIKIPEAAICERTFLKIPASYVSQLRDNNIVKKKTGSVVEQVIINTKTLRSIDSGEDYIYIMQNFDNIRRGDTIVLNDTDEVGYVIDEIATSKGVFRTNNGLATFVSINTDGMVRGNKGYVILNTENNNSVGGLKLYDRIISDATSNFIKEGDIVN